MGDGVSGEGDKIIDGVTIGATIEMIGVTMALLLEGLGTALLEELMTLAAAQYPKPSMNWQFPEQHFLRGSPVPQLTPMSRQLGGGAEGDGEADADAVATGPLEELGTTLLEELTTSTAAQYPKPR